MGAPQRIQVHDQEQLDTTPWLVDFIRARMVLDGVTQRMVADLTGLSKSRVGTILHSDRSKRRPIRVTEVSIILKTLNINELEAHFASELLDRDSNTEPTYDSQGYMRVVDLVSEVVRGLPAKLTEALMHLDGLEFNSIRKEHGRGIQKAVINLVIKEYQDSIDRRDSRPNRLITFDI